MMLKCPHCASFGPHEVFERPESPELIADGYDPHRVSLAWFKCLSCSKSSPFFSWKKEEPDDPSGFNTYEDDGVTRYLYGTDKLPIPGIFLL